MQHIDAERDAEAGQIDATYSVDDLHWSTGGEEAATPELAVDLQRIRTDQRVLKRTDWATVEGRLKAVRETIIRIL